MSLLPFTLHYLRIAGTVLVLSLCLLAACAPPVSRIPGAPVSGDAVREDPRHDAQARLLKEAYRAIVQERYPTAVLYLRRYVENSSNSSRLAEAHWWLGRGYEQLGDFRSATSHYHVVAAGRLSGQVNGALYEGHARRRLEELSQLHPGPLAGRARRLAMRVTMGQLPPPPARSPWLQNLAQEGLTVLVVDPVSSPGSGVGTVNREHVTEIVKDAHRFGILVWVLVDLHLGRGMEIKPEWVAMTVTGAGGEGISTKRPDHLNPGYQSYVETFIRELTRTECDGIFLATRPMTGFSGEFSGESFRVFASTFRTDIALEEVFKLNHIPDSPSQERTAGYWRWVGWKARNYAEFVARLRILLRESNPTATLLVEVHQTTLGDPLYGLEQYGEDIAALAPPTGGPLAVRRELRGGEALLEKLTQQLGSTDRIWLGITVPQSTLSPVTGGFTQFLSEHSETSRWNTIILNDAGQFVP